MAGKNSTFALKRFCAFMEGYAPTRLADRSWDNVGLLLESETILKAGEPFRVFLTIDLTEAVFNEAVKSNAHAVLAYHPPWFNSRKCLTFDPKAGSMRVVALCAANRISIYSPHSALDSIVGGMNDFVASVISPTTAANANRRLTPLKCIKDEADGVGLGRLLTLENTTSLIEIISRWKVFSSAKHLRMALPHGCTVDSFASISSIAICVGSGSSIFRDNAQKAQLYFTGELSHHDILHLTSQGAAVLLTEHTNCERGFLSHVLLPTLQSALPTKPHQNGDEEDYFEFLISQEDRDPVQFV